MFMALTQKRRQGKKAMSDEVKLYFYLGLLMGVLFLYYCTDFFEFIIDITLGKAAKKAADSIADTVQGKKQSEERDMLMNQDKVGAGSAEMSSQNIEVVTLSSLYGTKSNNQTNQKITYSKKTPQTIAPETLSTKFCSECGTELQIDDRYCHICGTAVDSE